MKKIGRTFLKLSVAAVVTIGVSGREASAQPVTASFTLPYEVSWGKSVLAAGEYTITIESPRSPALVRSLSGQGRALVMPATVNRAMNDQPTSIILARSENGHEVRTLNLREANVSLGYGLSKPERKHVSRVDEPATYAGISGK